jgi:hypothetical protein
MRLEPKAAIYSIVAIVIIGSLATAYFVTVRDQSKDRRLISEALATIENVDAIRAYQPVDGYEYNVAVDVLFSYSIDEKQYRRTVRMRKVEASLFVPWGKAKVCYDPSDERTVENARLFPISHKCGGD